MILAVSLVILLFASDASSQTVVTYSSKSSEELICSITDDTFSAIWSDDTAENTLANYVKGRQPELEIVDKGSKYTNFMYNVSATAFSLYIQNVQADDGGDYGCATIGGEGPRNDYTVVVEVLAKPTVQYESQDVDVLDVIVGTPYVLTCSATGARSVSGLSLMWDPPLVENNDLIVTPNGNFTDYSITSTYIAKKDDSTITCQLTGYVTQDEINDQLITDTVNLNVWYAPMCSLVIQEGEDCREVTLTCDNCDAVPADITLYSFFNGSSQIHNGTVNMFTTSVAYGTLSSFSCSATNSIGSGEQTPAKDHNCDEATESTTEKSGSTTTKKPDPDFPIWVIILIIVVVLAVVIAVIAVIMYKKGKCGSNSSSSSVTDVKVTATNSHTTNSEPAPAPVYGEIKKDRKKKSSNSGKGIENDGMDPPTDYAEVKMKSDKLDDNGAGPRGDPEIPAYGVVDKNRTKDPTPAPRSSMRDSKNPSNPKQDGPMEMQYADLDHGNKPASDEVRKPKEEPTEYATVQSVIV